MARTSRVATRALVLACLAQLGLCRDPASDSCANHGLPPLCNSTMNEKAVEKVASVLDSLPSGTRVGVVTLLGSLCPITLGHVQGFIEARRLLLGESDHPRPARLERFGAVVGFISLNGDGYVGRKLQKKGEGSLSVRERQHLVQLAAAPHPWLAWESHEGANMAQLAVRWDPKRKPAEKQRKLCSQLSQLLKVHTFGTVRPGMQRVSVVVGPFLLVAAAIICFAKA